MQSASMINRQSSTITYDNMIWSIVRFFMRKNTFHHGRMKQSSRIWIPESLICLTRQKCSNLTNRKITGTKRSIMAKMEAKLTNNLGGGGGGGTR